MVQLLLPVVTNYTNETQFGSGLHGGCIAFPHLYTKAAISIAHARNKSAVIVFIDVKTAFASMVRELILPGLYLSVLRSRLEKAGFSEEDSLNILNDTIRYLIFRHHGGSEHLEYALARLHKNTWCSTEGLPGAVSTESGSLAGHPLGDIVFAMAISRLLMMIETRFLSAGLLLKLDVDKIKGVFGIENHTRTPPFLCGTSYVDDATFALLCAACMIEETIRTAARILDTELGKFGLTVNYAKGKTEMVVVFKGPQAPKIKVKLLIELGGVINFTNDQGTNKSVLITSVYKNLGILLTVSGSQGPELTARLGAMFGTFKGIRKRVLKNENLPLPRRMLIVQSLLLAKGLFHAGAWHSLTIAEARKVHSKVMAIYRGVLRLDSPGCEHVCDDDVIAKLRVFAPITIIVYLRIAVFFRVIAKAPGRLLLVLAASFGSAKSWLRTVHENLLALAVKSLLLAELRNGEVMDWADVYIRNPGLLGTIQKALQSDDCNKQESWMSFTPFEAFEVPRSVCNVCGYSCKTIQGLNWQLFRVHNVRASIRCKIPGTVCCCCLKEFHTRERIVRHVAISSNRCHTMYSEFLDIPNETLLALEVATLESSNALAAKGRRRVHAELPPSRTIGPLHPRANELGVCFINLLATGKRVDIVGEPQ